MELLLVIFLPFFVAPALLWLVLLFGEAMIDGVMGFFGGR